MSDIFASEGIQPDEIAPLPAAATDINSLGERQGTPSGRPAGIVSLTQPKQIQDPQPINTPQAAPGAIPQLTPNIDDGENAQPASNDNQDSIQIPDKPAPDQITDTGAALEQPGKPKDLFQTEGIAAPSIGEQNIDAFNNGVYLNQPSSDPNVQAAQQYAKQDEDQITMLAKTRFSPEQLEKWKDKPIGFWEAFDKLDTSQVVPGGGLKRLYDAGDILYIGDKIKNGEEVTAADQEKLNAYVDQEIEMRLRGFSWGGKIAYTGSQIPAFAIEFAATGGAGKVAQKAVVKGAEELAINQAVKVAAGVATRIGVQSALMVPSIASKYGDQRLNAITTVTDKGQLVMHDATESPAVSALKAYGYTAAEVAGQLAAPVIGKYVVSPVTKAVSTPLIAGVNQLPAVVKMSLYNAYKTIQPNAQVSKVLTQLGWTGMLEQLGANRVTDALHGATDLAVDKNYTASDYIDHLTPSGDQLLLEAGLIGIGGSVSTATHVSFNLMKSKGMSDSAASETVNNMSENEKEQFNQDNLPTPKSGYPKTKIDPYFEKKITTPPFDVDNKISYTDAKPGSAEFNRTAEIDAEYGYETRQYPELQEKPPTEGTKSVTAAPTSAAPEQAPTPAANAVIDAQGFENLDKGQPLINAKDDYRVSKQGDGYRVTALKAGKESPDYFEQDGLSKDELQQFLSARQNISQDNAPAPETAKMLAAEAPEGSFTEAQDFADGKPINGDTPEADMVRSQVDATEAKDPPPIIDDESMFNQAYRQLFNDLQPIQELPGKAAARGAKIKPGENAKLLTAVYAQNIETIRENLQVATSNWNEDGNRVVTGKSLKAITDDFDNIFITKEASREQRQKDFQDYLLAQRFLELKNVKEEAVTEEQIGKSITDLAKLQDKYGDDYKMIDTLATEVYDFQKRILNNLVTSGVMKPETYDMLVNKYPKYVPLQRVMDEQFSGALTSKGTFADANMNKVIKKLKGSDKEVKNVFHNIIGNTARILDLAMRNKVTGSVVNLKDFLPEYIQRAEIPIVKKGTAEVKVSYDAKLREKLTTAIEQLGGEFKHEKSVKVKGYKNVLGSYSEEESAVRLKIGSNEGTLSHEFGHMLDHKLGLREKMLKDPEVKKELQKLAEDRLSAKQELEPGEEGLKFKETERQIGSDKYLKYIKNDHEIIANFYDAYVNSPKQVDEIAPRAKEAFEKIIDADPNLAFVKDIKPSTNRAEETVTKNVYGEADYEQPNTVRYYRDGVREDYRIAKPIADAMKNLSPYKIGLVEKILTAPLKISAAVLRTGATLTPEFVVRNIMRDQHDAFLQSNVGYKPWNFARGLFSAIGHDDLYHQWASSGGKFNSYMSLDDAGIAKAYKELFNPKGKLERYLKNPLNIMHDISQAGEQGTRIGVFSAAKNKGLSDIEAAYASLEATLNFARGGSVGKRINRYIPFFNAGLQAGDKLVRTFKNNPKALTFWGVATITVPSVLLTGYYLYGAPDKDRQEYLQIPQWQKDMFWLVKVGDQWKRYPKPFTYGYLFGSIPERMMNWAYAGDKPEMKNAFTSTVAGLASSVSPVNDWSAVLPPIVKAVVQDITNYDFFRGKPIYPKWMDELTPEKRSTKYTTETSKVLGEKLGMSPAMIDSTVNELAGGSGKYALDAGDKILKQVKEWNGEKVPAKPIDPADIPLIKAFAVRNPSGFGSNSAQEFFEKYDKVSQERATFKKLAGQEQSQYLKDNSGAINQYGMMNAAYKQMRAVQKQADAIYDDKNMSGEQKTQRIDKLDDMITNIARNANLQYIKATRKP